MKVVLFNHRSRKIKKNLFGQSIKKIDLLFPDVRRSKIHMIFVDDLEIHELNRRYLGRDYSTDVLSFTYEEAGFLGELYISIDTLQRQAAEYCQTLEDELNKIFVHGFLHLRGFTHDRVADTKKMRAIELKLLS